MLSDHKARQWIESVAGDAEPEAQEAQTPASESGYAQRERTSTFTSP